MSITDIMQQAQSLSPEDRKVLVKLLVDSLEVSPAPDPVQESHWGQALLRRLDDMEAIEFLHPELVDPVEWLRQVREERILRFQDGDE